LHASERPGEHDEIERFSLDLELLRRRDAVADPSDKFGRERTPRRYQQSHLLASLLDRKSM